MTLLRVLHWRGSPPPPAVMGSPPGSCTLKRSARQALTGGRSHGGWANRTFGQLRDEKFCRHASPDKGLSSQGTLSFRVPMHPVSRLICHEFFLQVFSGTFGNCFGILCHTSPQALLSPSPPAPWWCRPLVVRSRVWPSGRRGHVRGQFGLIRIFPRPGPACWRHELFLRRFGFVVRFLSPLCSFSRAFRRCGVRAV